jgi:hypothetical protein
VAVVQLWIVRPFHTMKKIASLIIIWLLLCPVAYSVTDSDPATRALDIEQGDLQVVLKACASLVERELEESPEVQKMHTPITVHPDHLVSMKEMIKLVEKAIKEQAGVFLKPVGSKKLLATLEK